MYKKTIKYTDFNDVEKTRDHYFNLTEAEVTEMECSVNGGYTELLNRIIAAENPTELIAVFKELILKSYGERSLDGETFVKNDEVRAKFVNSAAYSALFMELAFDAKAASDFSLGILPASMRGKVSEEMAKRNATNAPAAPITPVTQA